MKMTLEEFKARVNSGSSLYAFETAMWRATLFMYSDRGTLDADGKNIDFGENYQDKSGARVLTVGLDLRTPGWVFVWNTAACQYACIPSDSLRRSPNEIAQ